jgi:hypothetical protein
MVILSDGENTSKMDSIVEIIQQFLDRMAKIDDKPLIF